MALSKRAESFHAVLSEFFGNRLDEAYDIDSALRRKNAGLLKPQNQHELISSRR